MSVTFTAVDRSRAITMTASDGRLYERPAVVVSEDQLYFNMSNTNAAYFLSMLATALGLDSLGDYYAGDMELAVARRAVFSARAKFDELAKTHTRETEVVHGTPRENEDGVVELRPVRAVFHGIDREYLERRLKMFDNLVEAAAAAGATHITWG